MAAPEEAIIAIMIMIPIGVLTAGIRTGVQMTGIQATRIGTQTGN